MKVELWAEPPDVDVLFVTRNLRERDREEIFATREDGPEGLARAVVQSGAFRWGAYIDGQPVAMIGAVPRWKGVWSAWAFGTDDWPKVALTLTKHVRRFMIPALFNAGAHRVDCLALATHDDARLWLGRLGARGGRVLDRYGREGQDFVEYVWTRESVATPRP